MNLYKSILLILMAYFLLIFYLRNFSKGSKGILQHQE